MSADNKLIVRRHFKDFLSKGNLAVADQIIAPNHIHHDWPALSSQSPASLLDSYG